ncbi:MAG: TetR/AcrR family transcriptional regulator [Salinisphaera sp.]|jgi:TetR/AcrR family transcriptional repressor of mexJK operon|nr:TetR/AcrR family transcriptional regulator [Salinisphaera sp.]
MGEKPALENGSTEFCCRSLKSEQVLDAAKRLFIEHGFGATSMDAIARAAGVSKATVYAHHDSKQALFAATARRECRRVVGEMAIADGAQHLDLETALTRIGRSFIKAILSEETMALLRMVIAEVARFPEIGHIFYTSAPRQTQIDVTRYLQRARERGLIQAADCELAAIQFLGMLRGDALIAGLLGEHPSQRDNERVITAAVSTFVARYGADGR